MSEFEEYRNSKSGYEVPEGYFENKRHKLMAIADEKPRGGKLFRLNYGLMLSGIAAILILGIFIFRPQPDPAVPLNTSFEQEELAEFIVSSYNYELNEELIMLEMSAQDISELDTVYLSDEELNSILDEDFDQILNYEYL